MKLKHLLTGLFILALYSASFGQARAFRDFIIAANSLTNPKAGQNVFQSNGGLERFELEKWGTGWAISRGDELIKEGYSFNFDYQKNDLYVRNDKEDMTVVVDTNSVRRFVIFNGIDSLLFVKNISIDPTNKVFFQVVGGNTNGKVALLKLRLAHEIPINKNDYARNFSGDYTIHYRSEVEYYIVDRDKGIKSYPNLSRKELLSLYPEYSDLISRYLQNNKKADDATLGMIFNGINGSGNGS